VNGENLMKGLDYRHLPELSPRYRLNTGFAYYSAVGYVTMRGTAYESKCIWCHNPHDARVLPQHEDWAESGHGNTNAGPFASRNRDFKTLGTTVPWENAFGNSCVRCHTASGFINLVTSGMKDVSPWGLGSDGKTPISTTRQSLYCSVCHDNGSGRAYGYSLRSIPAFGSTGGIRVYYNYSATTAAATLSTLASVKISDYVDYPNVGISDRCILCHSGRGTGDLIKMAGYATDSRGNMFSFKNNNRIGMHDFASGATLFERAGFEYYSSYRYAGTGTIEHIHDLIGAGYPGTGSRGPCVSCHMSSAKSHEFLPVTLGESSVISINTALCANCHSSGKIGAERFNGTVADLNTKKEGYNATRRALFVWLNKKGITSTSNWLKSSTYGWEGAPAYVGTCKPTEGADIYFGSRNMGAAFNYDFMNNESAAYVHNDQYAKRLIYDSLDWLDDCKLNGTGARAVTDAGSIDYFGNSVVSGQLSSLTADEVTSALNYLFGVPNNLVRP
jgi:mono/diheme cytochrome c family protein